jgi:acetoin utilization deacetylase AcuC-like enzyme
MSTLPVFYSPKYLYAKITSDTTTKAAAVAASLEVQPIKYVQVREPSRAITASEIALVHSPEYAKAIVTGSNRALADSNGLCSWTPEFASSRLWATGGVRDAVLEALRTRGNAGSMSSGLHHARYDYGKGYCTINGLAIGAKLALQEGAKRVLIVDLDAHGGGGTASLIAGIPGIEQIDVSVSSYDDYVGTPQCNYTLVSTASDYLPVVRTALARCANPESIDLVIYNAGVDPHQDCTTGGLRGITTEMLNERENIVFSWAKTHNIPVAFVFAGGYLSSKLDETTLVQLHRNTIGQAALSQY